MSNQRCVESSFCKIIEFIRPLFHFPAPGMFPGILSTYIGIQFLQNSVSTGDINFGFKTSPISFIFLWSPMAFAGILLLIASYSPECQVNLINV